MVAITFLHPRPAGTMFLKSTSSAPYDVGRKEDRGLMAPDQGRRSALAKLVFGGLAVIVAGLGSLLGLAATPRTTPRAKRWRRAASMFDLPPDKPMLVVLTDRRADGWYEARAEMPIFIDRDGPNGYRAVS